MAKFCPGAVQFVDKSLYLTADTEICNKSILEHCKCGHYQQYNWVKPYCANWNSNGQTVCFLSDGINASACPGAVELGNESIYWTGDAEICSQSENNILEYCKCGYYPDHLVGPYCTQWKNNESEFCLLSGGSNGKFCPGAFQVKNESIYGTGNEKLCAQSRNFTLENCKCGHYPAYPVGPYCAKWSEDDTPYCLLSGAFNASGCPGAKKMQNEFIFWTEDEGICAQSVNYTLENCKCGHDLDHPVVGPYCANWLGSDTEYCLLAGGSSAKFCPGAYQMKNGSMYFTEDKEVCNRSITPHPEIISLGVRQPFTVSEIAQICIYALSILIGTCGNALVIKYFSFGDASIRAGSRFVVILAAIDIVSSLWLPGYYIVINISYRFHLYTSPEFAHWPFGKVACHIFPFYPLLLYATAWILLAISMERARAIFRPFAEKLSAKFVIIVSSVVLIASGALYLSVGLRFRYLANLNIYINGTMYAYSKCTMRMKEMERLIVNFVRLAIGIWTPMLVTVGGVYPSVFETEETGRNQKKQLFARLKQTDDSDITDLYHSPDCFLHLLFAKYHTVYCG